MKREDNGTLINRLTDRIFSPVSMNNRYMICTHDDDVIYTMILYIIYTSIY